MTFACRAGGGGLRYRAGRAYAGSCGDYLAIVTLGFGEIIRILMRNLDRPVNITNGAKGISGVDTLSLFGLKFSGVYHWFGFKVPALWLWYYLLMLVIVAIILSACGYSIRALAAPARHPRG